MRVAHDVYGLSDSIRPAHGLRRTDTGRRIRQEHTGRLAQDSAHELQAMRIKEVAISGYRSVRKQTIELDRLTAFVGRNGAGKSAILQAIRTFVEPERGVDAEDFYGGYVGGKVVEIKITFTELSPEEQSAFRKYTRTGDLTVAKRFMSPGKGSYFGYTQRHPDLAKLLQSGENRTELRKSFNAIVDSGRLPGLQKATSYDDMLAKIDAWQTQNPALCQWLEEGTQFYGFAGKYALNEYTKFVFVPAVREAADEVSSGSLRELVNTVVLRRISENPRVVDFAQRFRREAEEIFRLDHFPALGDLSSELNKTLRRLSPGASIEIVWGEFTPPPLKPPQHEAKLSEDGYSGDPSRKGHGLQRALVMTLLQHLSMLSTTPSAATAPPSDEPPPAAPPRADLVFLIEEPELYLHPHRSRYLANLLAKLAESSPALGRNQVVFSTHSPYFVQLDHFDQVRLVAKVAPADPGRPSETECRSYRRADAAQRLGTPKGADPDAAFLARCRPVVNALVNEGFFADAVLVVEGLTELGIFSALAEKLDARWDEAGIVVIPAGGKNNIDRPVIIFEGFKIPVYWVFDTDEDVEAEEGTRQRVGDKNMKLQKELGAIASPVPFPDTYVGDKCAALRQDIESYLRTAVGDEMFRTLRREVADDLGYTSEAKTEGVLKNTSGAALFVRKVYDKGLSLPVLEQIVQKVTALAPRHP